MYRLALRALKPLNPKYFIFRLANATVPLARVHKFNQYEATMFFGKKKIREKKFIDYVLEDMPFGLDDLLVMDQIFNSSNCLRV